MSSRAKTYKNYLDFLSPASATRVLLFFGASLAGAEVVARIIDPPYKRSAVSSLHGVRAIFQQALGYDSPKILAFGDSTLLGGGIHDHNASVIGRLSQQIREPRFFNLAVPGGGNTTTTLLLDAMRRQRVEKVDRVIIEVLPSKYLTRTPRNPIGKEQLQPTWTELRRFIPGLDFQSAEMEMPPQSLSNRVEVAAQWELGQFSRLYRHRDYFRTEHIGNYPPFWLMGQLMTRSLLARISGKSKGTNRLGARVQDFDFDPEEAMPSSGGPVVVSPGFEGEYLLRSITLAKSISRKPPILWAFPLHYESQKISDAERVAFQQATRDFEDYLRAVARKEGCELMIIPSAHFQAPHLWTVTAAHFNNAGAARIAQMLRPSMCRLYNCVSIQKR